MLTHPHVHSLLPVRCKRRMLYWSTAVADAVATPPLRLAPQAPTRSLWSWALTKTTCRCGCRCVGGTACCSAQALKACGRTHACGCCTLPLGEHRACCLLPSSNCLLTARCSWDARHQQNAGYDNYFFGKFLNHYTEKRQKYQEAGYYPKGWKHFEPVAQVRTLHRTSGG